MAVWLFFKKRMMMKSIVFSLVGAALIATPSFAQKKEIGDARDIIKSGQHVEKAEKLMTDLIKKNAENRENPKVLQTWFDAVLAQYQQANEKLYLKQKYDTAAFFNMTKRLFNIGVALDSVDARPDKKGRTHLEYRKKHAQLLCQLRPNLYNGGMFHYRKGEYALSFDYLEQYIDAGRQPLFTGYDLEKTDSMMPQAAYWATSCGHRLKDADRTLRYSELALRDKSKSNYTLQYMCDAYLSQKNDSAYVRTLRQGFDRYPTYTYFFPRLADYYTAQGNNDSVLTIADRGLQVDENNTLFLLAKSLALLNLERYEECISVSQKMLAQNEKLPEPNFNIATCYLNQALELEQLNEPRTYRQQLQQLYSDARPYMERYRELQPSDKQRWAPALYRIYLNLNMGRQFEEIDRLMKQ